MKKIMNVLEHSQSTLPDVQPTARKVSAYGGSKNTEIFKLMKERKKYEFHIVNPST